MDALLVLETLVYNLDIDGLSPLQNRPWLFVSTLPHRALVPYSCARNCTCCGQQPDRRSLMSGSADLRYGQRLDPHS